MLCTDIYFISLPSWGLAEISRHVRENQLERQDEEGKIKVAHICEQEPFLFASTV